MAFGNLFNKIAGSVKGALDRISRGQSQTTYSNMPRETPAAAAPPPQQRDNVYFWMQTTGLKKVASDVTAGILVHLDQDVSSTLVDSIGQIGVQRFQEALRPLRRSGNLEESFTYRLVNNRSVLIYSDSPVASAIQYGYEGVGSIESLQEWMSRKAEFSALDEKEQRRAAYFIQKKLRSHHPPGGGSTLRQLSPVGERRYDYLSVVRESLDKDIAELIDTYVNAADSGV